MKHYKKENIKHCFHALNLDTLIHRSQMKKNEKNKETKPNENKIDRFQHLSVNYGIISANLI